VRPNRGRWASHFQPMRPNTLLSIAGYLAAFTAAVQTLAGTYEVHAPLLNSTLAKPLSLLLYSCWHLVTATLCLSAWALLRPPEPRTVQSQAVLAGAIGLLWTLFGLVFIGVALLFGESVTTLLVLPQWVLLAPVGVLAWVGSRKLLAASA
jgi:hypothetical protein